MEALADNHHLICRKDVWYYRRRIPDDLRPIIGAAEISKSLRTASVTEARTHRAGLDLRYDLEFAELRSRLKKAKPSAPVHRLTTAEVQECVRVYVDQQIVGFETRYLNAPPASMEDLREARINKAIDLQTINDLDHPEQQRRVALAFDKVLGSADFYDLTEAGAVEIVRRGLGVILDRELAFLNGTAIDAIGRTVANEKSNQTSATFGDVAHEYLAEEQEKARLNRRRPTWIKKIEGHVLLLLEVVGRSTAIGEVDYDVALKIRDLVARLPAHREKRFKGLSPTAAAKRAERLGGALLSPSSQNSTSMSSEISWRWRHGGG